MKRSKPSTVVGGGEMKRDTSSVVSIASSAGASSSRISRSLNADPARTGRPAFQSLVVITVSRVDRISSFARIMVVARSILGCKVCCSVTDRFRRGRQEQHGDSSTRIARPHTALPAALD